MEASVSKLRDFSQPHFRASKPVSAQKTENGNTQHTEPAYGQTVPSHHLGQARFHPGHLRFDPAS